jgi:predicted nucleotidyltransferase
MDAWAGELLARPEVHEVIVFGSFENDTYAPGSDLDVLIVLDASPLAIADRAAEYRPLQFPVPIDLFAFTRAELEARFQTPLGRAIQTSRWRYRR